MFPLSDVRRAKDVKDCFRKDIRTHLKTQLQTFTKKHRSEKAVTNVHGETGRRIALSRSGSGRYRRPSVPPPRTSPSHSSEIAAISRHARCARTRRSLRRNTWMILAPDPGHSGAKVPKWGLGHASAILTKSRTMRFSQDSSSFLFLGAIAAATACFPSR